MQSQFLRSKIKRNSALPVELMISNHIGVEPITSISHKTACNFRENKRRTQYGPSYFFLLISFLMIHPMMNTHTITSPNTMMNTEPPILIKSTVKATNIISMSNRIVSKNIFLIAPFFIFIKRDADIAKRRAEALHSNSIRFLISNFFDNLSWNF